MMVASGLGTSVLPQSAVQGHYQSDLVAVRAFEMPQPMRTVAIAWRASFPRPKAIDVLIEALSRCQLAAPDATA